MGRQEEVGPTMSDTEHQDADHEALRTMRDAFVLAYNQRDINGMLEVLDHRVTFTAMNGEAVYGHEGVREYHERLCDGPNPTVQGTSITLVEVDRLTELHQGNFGAAAGYADTSYQLAGGLKFSTRIRWSCCMVKSDGEWKVVSMHTSSNIFENPVLGLAKKAGLIKSVLAGGLGLLVGWLIGRPR